MGVVGKRISGEEWEQMETEFQEKNEMEMSEKYQGMIKKYSPNPTSDLPIQSVAPVKANRQGA